MAPTSQEVTALLVVALGMVLGIMWLLRAIKKEKEERESESYKFWYNF